LHLGAINMAFAHAYMKMRKPVIATSYIVEAKVHYIESSQPWRIELCRPEEATALWASREYERAKEIYAEIAEAAEDSGDKGFAATQWGNVAMCESRLGYHERARAMFRHLLPIYDRLGLEYNRATTMCELGRMAIRESGRLDEMLCGLLELDRLGAISEWVIAHLVIAEEMALRGDITAQMIALQKGYRRAVAFHLKVDAVTALDMLRKMAQRGEATPEAIREVAESTDFSVDRQVMGCDGSIN
ncbi:MAG TPA: hypothetical protein VJ865_04565, partial [Gemmatimonadaceae bacterium]|nr:hypothetical protein [Gemmatimonadaceae bacterium]